MRHSVVLIVRSVLATNTDGPLKSLAPGGEGRGIPDRIDIDPDLINTRDDLGAALTALRQRAGYTVRELATRAGLPRATADGYVRGKHLPSLAQVEPFRSLLVACGITAEDELLAWQEAVARIRASSDGRVGESRGRRRGESTGNPYRGLRHLDVEDAGLFFGREAFVGEVLDRLARLRDSTADGLRLLFIVGASGSGKSSALRAGIVPAVAEGALSGGGRWSTPVMVPGADPAGALENALAATQSPATSTGAAGTGTQRLLVIDQFEQLYTHISEDAERERFAAALAALGSDTLIVAGLRADFLTSVAGDAVFAPSLEDWRMSIPRLSEVELCAAVASPAEACGATVDKALVDLVLSDVLPVRRPGAAADHCALPLLSQALFLAWEHHTYSHLTVADYQAGGGLHAAVRQIAKQVDQELSLPDRELARRMLLRLVDVDEDGIAGRRRAAREELSATDPGITTKMGELLEYFVARRLITADEQHIEISHDALLTAWPRLAEWIAADHAGLRTHRRLTSAANGWRSAGRDDRLLMRDGVLADVEEWAGDADNRAAMNGLEVMYLSASTRARATTHGRTRRRIRAPRRRLVAAAVLLLVAVAVLGYVLRNTGIGHTRRQWTASTNFPGCSPPIALTAPTTPTGSAAPPAPAGSQPVTQAIRLRAPSAKATQDAKTPPGQLKPKNNPHQTAAAKHKNAKA